MRLLEKTKISVLKERYDYIVGWGAAEREFVKRYNVSMYQMDCMIDGDESKIGRIICGCEIQRKDILKEYLRDKTDKKILIVIFPNCEEEIENQAREYLSEFDTIVARLVDFGEQTNLRSYSNDSEDLVLLGLLKWLGIKEPSYIDLGVCHPVIRNNTYLLYERGYTEGLLIEPNVDMCKLINEYRPSNKLLQIGVTGSEGGGRLRYYTSHSSSYRGHNTFVKEIAEEQGFSDNYREIPVYNINRIIRENCKKTPDLLDIDVEGMDYEILNGLDLNKYRFKVICVEIWRNMEEKFRDIFKANRYVHYASSVENKIYIAEEVYESRLK